VAGFEGLRFAAPTKRHARAIASPRRTAGERDAQPKLQQVRDRRTRVIIRLDELSFESLEGANAVRVFDLLHLLDPEVTPREAKVHLAVSNGEDDPLRVYHAGNFDEWQSFQTRRNFERPFVVSLIQLPERDRWLYVGTFYVGSLLEHPGNPFKYGMSRRPACEELQGRLIVAYARPGRQSYLYGETCAPSMTVHEIRAEPLHLEEFPGFKKVDLPFSELEMIVHQRTTSWRTALANVAGVYLISDREAGKLYVGSATGEGGIWSRWSSYADGHGKNKALEELVTKEGAARAAAFRFTILEIADLHASTEEVLQRESHWKRVLLTRDRGHNRN
jgi:GIY-YIG catalytic domain